jgi:hypothetical protein
MPMEMDMDGNLSFSPKTSFPEGYKQGALVDGLQKTWTQFVGHLEGGSQDLVGQGFEREGHGRGYLGGVEQEDREMKKNGTGMEGMKGITRKEFL